MTPDQQSERPYAFGQQEVIVSPDHKFKKDQELIVLFQIYNPTLTDKKFNIEATYTFYQQAPDGEKKFNSTEPQAFTPESMGASFDPATAEQSIQAGQGIPLKSFPEGNFRLEIKVVDKLANPAKTLTQNVNFTVTPSGATEESMGRLNRIVIAVLVVGTTAAAVYAQTEPRFMATNQTARITLGSIRGSVSDDRGGPLSGAMVSALGVTTAMVMTDARGRFALDALPPGEYIVRVHLPGFLSTRRDNIRVGPLPATLDRIQLHRVEHLVGTQGRTRRLASDPGSRPRRAGRRGRSRQLRRPSALRARVEAPARQAQRPEGQR